MWNFQSKRNSLRDRLLMAAPETNPHEFVRRYLAKPRPTLLPGDQIRRLDQSQQSGSRASNA